MAGQRQPIDLVVYKGKKHLTKDEVERRKTAEVKADSDAVQAPAFLRAHLRPDFDRIAGELTEIGIMSNLDCETLAWYLMYMDDYITLDERCTDAEDIKTLSDLYCLKNTAYKSAMVAAKELGLTISSRCRLVVPKPDEKPKNKFEKFGG